MPITGKDILDVLRTAGDERMQERLDKGDVELSPSDEVTALRPWVDRILRACNIDPEDIFLSDESHMGDLPPFDYPDGAERLSAALGVPVAGRDMVIEVARRLREADRAAAH